LKLENNATKFYHLYCTIVPKWGLKSCKNRNDDRREQEKTVLEGVIEAATEIGAAKQEQRAVEWSGLAEPWKEQMSSATGEWRER